MLFQQHGRQSVLQLRGQYAFALYGDTAEEVRLFRDRVCADCRASLPDNLLDRGDRMSMAASVELRSQFLDARLVHLAFRRPCSVKLRGRRTKWVVTKVSHRYLPDEVGRRNVGFTVPLDRWFYVGLSGLAWEVLTSESSMVVGLMSRDAVHELLSRYSCGERLEQTLIWMLLGLRVWHDVFFRGAGRQPSPQSVPGSRLRTVS